MSDPVVYKFKRIVRQGPWHYCPWCFFGTHMCTGVAPLGKCRCPCLTKS